MNSHQRDVRSARHFVIFFTLLNLLQLALALGGF